MQRAELRDLVDIFVLSERGYSIEEAMTTAALKDGGMTPAQLAWVLSDLELGDDAEPPAGVSVTQLRDFVRELRSRLAKLAWPGETR